MYVNELYEYSVQKTKVYNNSQQNSLPEWRLLIVLGYHEGLRRRNTAVTPGAPALFHQHGRRHDITA